MYNIFFALFIYILYQNTIYIKDDITFLLHQSDIISIILYIPSKL